MAEKRKGFMVSLRKDAVKQLMENRRKIFMGLMSKESRDNPESRYSKQEVEVN